MQRRYQTTVTVDKDVLKTAKVIAEQENRTLSNYMEWLMIQDARRKEVAKIKRK